MPGPLRVLLVEDVEDDAMLVLRALRGGGLDVVSERVYTEAAMAGALDRQEWDVILADYRMPRFNAFAALTLAIRRGLDIPFIVVSGTIGEETAVAAMKAGASDYVLKDNLARLAPAVIRELREAEDRRRRLQAEEALRESEQRFRRLAENAPDVIFRYRFYPEMAVEYISPAVFKVGGYTPEEFLADSGLLTRIVHPEDLPTLAGRLSDPSLAGSLVTLRWIAKDGHIVWTEHRSAPIRDELGTIVAVEGIARDITEAHAAREALAESERRFRGLVDSIDEVIYSATGADMMRARVEFVSSAVKGMLGYQPRDFIRDQDLFMSIMHPEDLGPIQAANEAMARRKRGGIRVYRLRHKERDEYRWFEDRVTLLLDEAGNISGLTGIARDISDRRRAQELEVRTRVAEQSEQLKQQLLATVSHELRTPLTTIRGFTSLLIEYLDRLGRDEILESLRLAENAAVQMEAQVSDLLTLSRLDAGVYRLEQECIDLGHTLEGAVATARIAWPHVSFVLTLPTAAIETTADAARLTEVLSNLIENSVKYGIDHAPIEVSVDAEPPGFATVAVRDRGVGVPEDSLAAIFEPYRRGGPQQTAAGTGLGLAICKGIVEAHGGRIEARGREGGGLEVIFTLPLCTETTAPSPGPAKNWDVP